MSDADIRALERAASRGSASTLELERLDRELVRRGEHDVQVSRLANALDVLATRMLSADGRGLWESEKPIDVLVRVHVRGVVPPRHDALALFRRENTLSLFKGSAEMMRSGLGGTSGLFSYSMDNLWIPFRENLSVLSPLWITDIIVVSRDERGRVTAPLRRVR